MLISHESAAAASALAVVSVPAWADLPWLVHGFSTRGGGRSRVYQGQSIRDHAMPGSAGGGPTGALNLGFTADDAREAVIANRSLLLDHLLGSRGQTEQHAPALVTVRQTHSATVHRVDESALLHPDSPPALEGDGLMTDRPGVLLGILTADCVPVLVVDARRRAVAAFHAGWRGTVQQIVELGVRRMLDEFGSAPEDLLAAVGPAIGACCYTVGDEVRQQFGARFAYADELFSASSTGLRLDLAAANRRQLLAAGLTPAAITMTGACTSCGVDRFFSHRADHGLTGRMMAVIGVRASE